VVKASTSSITPSPPFPGNVPHLKTIFGISDIYTDLYVDAQIVFDSITWPDAKFLVLAGNIGCSVAFDILAKFLILCKKKYEHVIYVPGNHEYINCKFDKASIDAKLEKLCNNCKVTYLHKNSVVIDGVRFIGDTLWSMEYTDKVISEYPQDVFEHKIDYISAHVESFQFIQKELFASMDTPEPVVVVTHYVPTRKLLKTSDKKEEIIYTDIISY
jgi:Icc-related predicted phosphoesterase